MKKVLLGAFLLFSASAFGQAPVNDECTKATNLSLYTTCLGMTGTLKNATTSTSELSTCSNYNDVFYTFTAGANPVTIKVTPVANLDAVLTVYSICGGSAISCVDNGSNGAVETLDVNPPASGQKYFIKVSSKLAAPTAYNFDVCIQDNPPPANDNCSNPTGLSIDEYCSGLSGSLKYAATSTTGCAGYKDLYYKFKPSVSDVKLRVIPEAGLNTTVSVFTDCANPNPTDLCVNNGGAGVQDVVYLTDLDTWKNYYIKVSSADAAPTAFNFNICLIEGTNDDKEFATELSGFAGWCDNNINLTTATQTPGLLSCDNNSDPQFNFKYDRWYKFVATNTTYTISASRKLSNSYGVELTSASGVSMLCKKAAVDANSSSIAAVVNASVNTLTIGDTYYLRIAYDGLGNYNEIFKLCATPAPLPPSATECSAAPELTIDGTALNGSLQNGRVFTTTTTCKTYTSTLYKFTAETANTTITVTPVSNLDVVVSLYNTCGGTLVKCINAKSTGEAETLSLTNLTPNQQYFIQVGNAGAVPNSGALPTFTIKAENITITPTGLTASESEQLNIFPNPASGTLTVKTSLSGNKNAELVSLNGLSFLQTNFSESEYKLNIESVPQGFYLLRLSDENGNYIIRKISIVK